MCNKLMVDDIIHHFILSRVVAFENWCNRTAKYQIKLTSTEIIFGIYHDNKSYKNMNYVILHAK